MLWKCAYMMSFNVLCLCGSSSELRIPELFP
jgi:hypothetical protein